MKARECFELLAPHSADAVVVCALGMSANEWWAVTESDETFYMHGAMGFASSFGLGIALGLPESQVWVFDGDGSFTMNLGAVLTEAGMGPSNLKHFVLDNRCYQTVGASPMVGSTTADYEAIGRGAGYSRTQSVGSVAELKDALPEILAPGLHLVVLRIECEDIPIVPPPQPFEGPEMKYRFGRSLENRFGIRIFHEQGY